MMQEWGHTVAYYSCHTPRYQAPQGTFCYWNIQRSSAQFQPYIWSKTSHSKYSTTVEPAFSRREAAWVCLYLRRQGRHQNQSLIGPALVFCLYLLLLHWWWWLCLGLPLITATTAVFLPSGGFLLGKILFFLSILSFWLDDVIMTSLASLTDVVLASLELLAIVVGVALIGLGGVKLVCSTVSLTLTNFLVLPNPTPYSELDLLSS